MICPRCNAFLSEGAAGCEFCGQPLPFATPPQPAVQQQMPYRQPAQQSAPPPVASVPKKKRGLTALLIALGVMAVAAVVIAVLFLTGVIGAGRTPALPGHYVLDYMADDERELDEETLEREHLSYYMVIDKDGTGWIAEEDDASTVVTDLTWSTRNILLDGEEITYRLEKDKLYMESGDAQWEFHKEAGKIPGRPRARAAGERPTAEDLFADVIGYYNCISIDGEAFITLYDSGEATYSLSGFYGLGTFEIDSHGNLTFDAEGRIFGGTFADDLISFSYDGRQYVFTAYGTDAYTAWKEELETVPETDMGGTGTGGAAAGTSGTGSGTGSGYVAPSTTIGVTFLSRIGYDLQMVQCSEVANDNWGEAVCNYLADGESVSLTLIGADGYYDLRMVDTDSWYYTFWSVYLTEGCTMEVTMDWENGNATLTVTDAQTSAEYQGEITY